MKLLLTLSCVLFFMSLHAQENSAFLPTKKSPPKKIGEMKLIWSDEFNNTGKPDTLNWKYEKGFVRNKELQWYTSENAYCSNGVLTIEGKRERVTNPNFDSISKNWKFNRKYTDYTSSCIHTNGLRSFCYGRFEIRARIDTSMGLWPAIWTLGVKGQWPQNGEIDLLEYYRINQLPYIFANVAWGTQQRWVAKWNSKKYLLNEITRNDTLWHTKFHIWRMDWNKDSICLYLDNHLLNTTYLNETINPDGTNPFHQPHYILLNLAIGENGGDPSQTRFPVKFEVDYVRVYQSNQKKK